ncbi:MAG: TonB-dependent receptor [Acidobacteriota bacterium]
MSKKRLGILATVLAITLCPTAWAQVTTGNISGTISDETSGVLPGVEVTLTNTDTSISRHVVSDDEGRYRASNLTLGSYAVQAELAGFQTSVRSGITLTVGSEALVDLTLSVGEITERVVVEGQAPMIESTSSTITGLVDAKKIRDLPLNGRSFTQLAALQEGVATPTNFASTQPGNEGQKLSIAGTRITETAFLLDGTDIRGHFNTTPGSVAGVSLGVDTVREFTVVIGAASAEYGGFTGGVINAVTRSGTNQLHGSIFEFHRNSALDARNFFDLDPVNPTERSSPPEFKRNQFGFTLGGPIIKDKTFFFGSYEGLRDRLTVSNTATVLDENARQGIFPNGIFNEFTGQVVNQIDVSPAIQPYLDTFPLPNGKNFGDGSAEFVFSNPIPTDEDYFMLKIDHNISDSDSLFVRYTLDDGEKSNLSAMPNFTELRENRSQFVTIEEKKILTPNLINEFRFAFNRNRADSDSEPFTSIDPSLKFVPLPDRKFGSLNLPSGFTGWGASALTRLEQTLNRFEYADNLVYTSGRHSLKFGFKYTRLQFNMTNCLFCPGQFTFFTTPSLLQASPFFLLVTLGNIDPPDELEAPFVRGKLGPVVKQGMRQNLFGFYVQDDFKVKSNLTLNLGLRYEFYTNPTEVADRISNLDEPLDSQVRVGGSVLSRNPSLKSFSPRIGFAWDPFGNGKTSVRGSGGIFYDFFGPNRFLGAQTSAPFFNRVAPLFPAFPNFVDTINDEVIQGGSGIFVFKTPNQSYIAQFNLTVQQEIAPETVVSVGYQGSRGIKLSRMNDVNIATPQVQNGRYFWPEGCITQIRRGEAPQPGCSARANPNFQMIRMFSFDSNSFFHSLRASLRRRFSNGFQFQSSYTFSRSIDEASNSGPFDGAGSVANGTANVFFDQRIDRGLSSFDVRHNFSMNGAVELPFGPGRAFGAGATGALGKLISGWQLSGILSLSDGNPVNLRVGFNRSRSQAGPDLSERPDLVVGADNNPVLGGPDQYFDVSSFVLQPEGVWGNLGRNTLTGPGVATLDLSLTKDTALNEDLTLQFRSEFFNILNRANFGVPANTIFSDASGTPVGNAGRITNTSTTARQIQFALKLVF